MSAFRIAPSWRTASTRCSGGSVAFFAAATARPTAAGSRKTTASLFASETCFGSASLTTAARRAAHPSGGFTVCPASATDSPSSALPRTAASFASAANLTHSARSAGFPVATSRRMTRGTIWSVTNGLPAAFAPSQSSSAPVCFANVFS